MGTTPLSREYAAADKARCIPAGSRYLQFGWDNIFASNGGTDLGKLGQGIHALQDAIAHGGVSTNDHLGGNFSSAGKFLNDLYGSTREAQALTHSAGIVTRLMAGKDVKFKKDEELHFKGMSSKQLSQTINLLFKAGFEGKINMN